MKFLNFIKKPPKWFIAVIAIIAVGSISGSILTLIFDCHGTMWEILSYLLYAVSAISLCYCVYLLIVGIPFIKKKSVDAMKKGKFTNRLLEQYGFRTEIFSLFSFMLNICYVGFNGFFAFSERSPWYGALTAYYFLLALMRGVVLLFHSRGDKGKDENGNDAKGRVRVYGMCGIGLIILPLVLSFAVLQIVFGENSFEHSGMAIYVSALYAFYKIIMAVINAVKAKRQAEITVRALRSINLADALVSILALQTAMFKEFGGDDIATVMNGATGAVVCLLTALLGIYMVVNAKKILKERKKDEQ
ncbi:MAG: hypothetical protein ACI4MS_04655 [Candidatus Coproplasma sp.]